MTAQAAPPASLPAPAAHPSPPAPTPTYAPAPQAHAAAPSGAPVHAAPAPAPWGGGTVPEPLAPEDTVLHGTVVVDAGPFTDLATLSAFEQALAGVPGVRGVYVRAIEGSRAMVEATLEAPLALGAALRRTAPVAFRVTHAGAGILAIAVEPR